jgi:Flp pilus assembly protein TadB
MEVALLASLFVSLCTGCYLTLAPDPLRGVRKRWVRVSKGYRLQPYVERLQVKMKQPSEEWMTRLNVLHIPYIVFQTIRLLVGVIVGVLSLFTPYPALAPVLFLVVFGLAPKAITLLYRRRQSMIQRDLPNFIDLLRVHLATGLNISQSLQVLSERLSGPMREELVRLCAEIEIHGDYHAALSQFAKRIGLQEIETFVEALRHGWDSGVVLDVFENQAEVIRAIRRYHITRRTKILPVVLNILPTFLVVNILLLFMIPLMWQVINQLMHISP